MFTPTSSGRLLLALQLIGLFSIRSCLGKIIDVDAGRVEPGGTTTVTPVGTIGLGFTPSIIAADVGDIVTFHFYPGNHSVVQSSFENPCEPLDDPNGPPPIFSGFFPTEEGSENGTQFAVPINTTEPIWLYCAQTLTAACQNGMTAVINQPSNNASQTHDKYDYAAERTSNSSAPPTIFGGILQTNNLTESDSVLNASEYPASPASTGSSTSDAIRLLSDSGFSAAATTVMLVALAFSFLLSG